MFLAHERKGAATMAQQHADVAPSEASVLEACHLLWGTGEDIGGSFLDTLDETRVKRAFRKVALATHPDRYVHHGEEVAKRYAERFITATRAYETLQAYLQLKAQRRVPSAPSRSMKQTARPATTRSSA
ncbi:MAG: hypothetical protein D6722_28395, partial [Bacteroidetes bacterium]